MFTPQQLAEIGFTKAVFGGYDMESVHDVLDPLTADYTTLYKENAVLKSKLRILVEKLEEYRQQEIASANNAKSQQAALQAGQEAVRDAEAKAAEMLRNARERASAILNEAKVGAKVRAGEMELEEDRLTQAKQAAASFIQVMEANIQRHQELLDNLKMLDLPQNAPAAPQSAPPAPKRAPAAPQNAPASPKAAAAPKPAPAPEAPEASDEIAKEIEQNLEKLVGSVPNSTYEAPSQDTKIMRPLHPESITAKFGDLQFGKNYNPK